MKTLATCCGQTNHVMQNEPARSRAEHFENWFYCLAPYVVVYGCEMFKASNLEVSYEFEMIVVLRAALWEELFHSDYWGVKDKEYICYPSLRETFKVSVFKLSDVLPFYQKRNFENSLNQMIGVLVVLTSKLRMLLKSVIIMKNLEFGSLFFNSDLQSRLFRDFNLFVFV